MSNSKFEIKITKEADGSDLDLSKMSLKASKSLVAILEAINEMAEAEGGANAITVSIRVGSAIVEMDVPDEIMDSVHRNVAAVLDRRPISGAYTRGLNSLQTLFNANGLTYETNVRFGDETIDLFEILRGSKKFRAKRKKRTESYFDIEFIEGRLIENGGVKPNIHIERGGQKQKVKCTEKQAKRVNKFLYSQVKLSTWVGKDADGKKEYFLCDNYLDENVFNEFKREMRLIVPGSGTERLKQVYRFFKVLIVNERFGDARKFVRLFNNRLVDNHLQRTILVAAKAFRSHDNFKDLMKSITKQLEKKTGKPII